MGEWLWLLWGGEKSRAPGCRMVEDSKATEWEGLASDNQVDGKGRLGGWQTQQAVARMQNATMSNGRSMRAARRLKIESNRTKTGKKQGVKRSEARRGGYDAAQGRRRETKEPEGRESFGCSQTQDSDSNADANGNGGSGKKNFHRTREVS